MVMKPANPAVGNCAITGRRCLIRPDYVSLVPFLRFCHRGGLRHFRGPVSPVRSGGMIGWAGNRGLGYELRLMKEARRFEQFDDPSTNVVIGFGYD
jgi:hypothetical protein